MPYRVGDNFPTDAVYFKLDVATYPAELKSLKNEMNSTVVKYFSRGRTAAGNTFRFTTNDTEETAFHDYALSLGLYVIPSYWFDPATDLTVAANQNAIATHFRTMVAAHKTHEAVIAWGAGQLKDSPRLFPNFNRIQNLMLLMARQGAVEENIPLNPSGATSACQARRPLVLTTGTVDLWGQLVYQAPVAQVPAVYMKFPDSPLIPAVPQRCIWEEWTSTLWLGPVLYSKYNYDYVRDPGVAGVSNRSRMRIQSWSEPVKTVSCPTAFPTIGTTGC